MPVLQLHMLVQTKPPTKLAAKPTLPPSTPHWLIPCGQVMDASEDKEDNKDVYCSDMKEELVVVDAEDRVDEDGGLKMGKLTKKKCLMITTCLSNSGLCTLCPVLMTQSHFIQLGT